jgi:transposase InsO family protein
MKFMFINEHRSGFRVKKMCRILGVSRSRYYAWRRRSKGPRQLENERLLERIKEAYKIGRRTYGSPRITKELKENGIHCGKNRVARLMRLHGIFAKTKRRFKVTTHIYHNLPVAENLLNRGFEMDKPNKVWLSDITYIWTQEGWLYLSAIMDLYNRQVIGWSMDERLTQELVLRALNQALGRRKPDPGVVFHSDRGSQYAGHAFRSILKQHYFSQSMSATGNCYDNAVMESFFHTLKTESVYFERYRTRAEARQSIFEYIEVFYNRIRRHSSLGYLSPLEFENRMLHKAA